MVHSGTCMNFPRLIEWPTRSVDRRVRRVLFRRPVVGVRSLRSAAWMIFALWMGLAGSVVAESKPETVRLQLKWRHQFQFAGYYAAESQGYYAEEGLKVEIIEGGATRSSLPAVLTGAAEYGVGDADIVLARIQGKPVVACAAIFQHSPNIVLSRADRSIRLPSDLVGAKVMLADNQGAAQLRAMLMREGIDPARVSILPLAWNLEDLIDGRVDAMTAYSTVEPYLLRSRGVPASVLRARDYGVDFYGDTLFTNEAELAAHPMRVRAFLRASLRGWAHALQNRDEMVDAILLLPGVAARGVTREFLLAEAAAMQRLILPEIVDIGHMNEGRWTRIAETFSAQGMAPASFSLKGFLYDPEPPVNRQLRSWLMGLVAFLSCLAAVVVVWNLEVRRQVRARTAELQAEVGRRREIEDALRGSEERLKQAQSIGRMGDWQFDVPTGRLTWSEPVLQLFDRDPALGEPTYDELLASYHPDDGLRLREGVRRALAHGEDYAFDLRVQRSDGREVWHYMVGRVVKDANGQVVRLLGIVHDITLRKQAKAKIRDQLHELERWREVTLGREERIRSLKMEINALLAEFGRAPRYADRSMNASNPSPGPPRSL